MSTDTQIRPHAFMDIGPRAHTSIHPQMPLRPYIVHSAHQHDGLLKHFPSAASGPHVLGGPSVASLYLESPYVHRCGKQRASWHARTPYPQKAVLPRAFWPHPPTTQDPQGGPFRHLPHTQRPAAGLRGTSHRQLAVFRYACGGPHHWPARIPRARL